MNESAYSKLILRQPNPLLTTSRCVRPTILQVKEKWPGDEENVERIARFVGSVTRTQRLPLVCYGKEENAAYRAVMEVMDSLEVPFVVCDMDNIVNEQDLYSHILSTIAEKLIHRFLSFCRVLKHEQGSNFDHPLVNLFALLISSRYGLDGWRCATTLVRWFSGRIDVSYYKANLGTFGNLTGQLETKAYENPVEPRSFFEAQMLELDRMKNEQGKLTARSNGIVNAVVAVAGSQYTRLRNLMICGFSKLIMSQDTKFSSEKSQLYTDFLTCSIMASRQHAIQEFSSFLKEVHSLHILTDDLFREVIELTAIPANISSVSHYPNYWLIFKNAESIASFSPSLLNFLIDMKSKVAGQSLNVVLITTTPTLLSGTVNSHFDQKDSALIVRWNGLQDIHSFVKYFEPKLSITFAIPSTSTKILLRIIYRSYHMQVGSSIQSWCDIVYLLFPFLIVPIKTALVHHSDAQALHLVSQPFLECFRNGTITPRIKILQSISMAEKILASREINSITSQSASSPSGDLDSAKYSDESRENAREGSQVGQKRRNRLESTVHGAYNHLIPEPSTNVGTHDLSCIDPLNASAVAIAMNSPEIMKYLMIAGFLASHNRQEFDIRYFTRSGATFKRPGRKSHVYHNPIAASTYILEGPQVFPLDRLLTIFHSIVAMAISPVKSYSVDHGAVLQSLRALEDSRLLLRISSVSEVDRIRYRCNINPSVAKLISESLSINLTHILHES